MAPVLLELVCRRLAVVADPVRLALLLLLERRGEMCVRDLADEVELSPQNASHHVGVLFREGLVARRKEGTTVFYELSDFSVCRVVELVREGVGARIEELGELIAE